MTVQVRPRLHAPEAQSVAFVELFFDLVFVFAVTQVTALTAHNLTPDGVLRSLVLFWMIWWAWTQFTWTLNPADTTHVVVRVITLAATASAFVMATTLSQAFLDDAVWFALPYLVVRILGLSLQVLVEMERTNDPRAAGIWRWAGTSAIGLALVLVGALADPSIRPLIWVLAILTDLLATQAASGRTWDIHVGHMAERHALFVIIAIGESLIVAGTAVAAHERTLPLVADSALALLIACLLWWTYFGWFKEGLEEQLDGSAPSGYRGPGSRRVQPRAFPDAVRDHRVRGWHRGDRGPSRRPAPERGAHRAGHRRRAIRRLLGGRLLADFGHDPDRSGCCPPRHGCRARVGRLAAAGVAARGRRDRAQRRRVVGASLAAGSRTPPPGRSAA